MGKCSKFMLLGILAASTTVGWCDPVFQQKFSDLKKCGAALGLADSNGVIALASPDIKSDVSVVYHYGQCQAGSCIHICREIDGGKLVRFSALEVSNPLAKRLRCALGNTPEELGPLRLAVTAKLQAFADTGVAKEKALAQLKELELCRQVESGLQEVFLRAYQKVRASDPALLQQLQKATDVAPSSADR